MRVEVLGGVERRRRWSRDDKMRIIEETLTPGAVVTGIARRHGIATSLVFTRDRHRPHRRVCEEVRSRSSVDVVVLDGEEPRLA